MGWASSNAIAGIYIEGAIGFPSSSAAPLFDDDDGSDPDFEVDFDSKDAFYGAVGIDGGLLRSELELSFRDTEMDNFQISGGGPTSGSGSFETISLMSNLYLDIPVGSISVWAGGGIGVVQFDGDVQSVGTLDASNFEDAAYGVAWQLRAGVTLDLTRNLSLNAGYRYWRAEEIDFKNVSLNETELHSVDIGLRLTF